MLSRVAIFRVLLTCTASLFLSSRVMLTSSSAVLSTDGIKPAGRAQSNVPEASLHEPLAKNPTVVERVLILEPGRAERHYWRDLWHYRELFAILAWRDVSVRYKQTVIGVAWAVVRPLLTMVVFTIVFGKLAGLPSDGGVPYPVLVFAGMLPWFLFASVLSEASTSPAGNANPLPKVYFPRLIIPASAAVVALVDFSVNLVILFAIMAWYGAVPGWQVLLLPFFIGLAVLASLGPALFVTALNV